LDLGPDDKAELEIALMTAQIEHLQIEREKLRAETERFRQDLRWEPWKALAAILAAAAIMTGAVLTLSTWIGHQPQTINVHLDAPLFAPQPPK
jgi:anti-sigma-K factor RskA